MSKDNQISAAGITTRCADTLREEQRGAAAKRPYAAPVLTDHGRVECTTLGLTGGAGESGNPTIFRNPGPILP